MCTPKDTDQEKQDRDQESDYEDPSEELDDEHEEEENICIRAKWSIDNASTIDEAVEKLNRFIEYLTSLKNEGWEFREPIQDDYGFLYKKEP
jgi:hypothetical protein